MRGGRTILVTDGEQRAALAAVRSLGAAGHRVHVVAARPGSLAAASRHAAAEHVLPDPLRRPDDFADAFASLAARTGADVALPVSEPALLAVLPARDRVPAALPFPSLEAFRAVCDKARVLATAPAHGIAAPAQLEARVPDDAAGWRGGFPVVLKPSRSVVESNGVRVKTGVGYADDPGSLRAALDALPAAAFPVLLQERIEGPGTALSVLVWDGELRAAFGHRRLREKPPSGGVSVLRESIPLDREVLGRSLALLRDFAWRGVAMVEFKVDARTGTPYLMEINGRLWGSLQLAIDAGVDFPGLLVEAALGGRSAPVTTYGVGVRTRWEWGEVDHLVARLRRSPAELSLPPGAPGRLRAIWDFVGAMLAGSRAEVFRAGDPRPFLRESAGWLRGR